MKIIEPHFILLTSEEEIRRFPREIEQYGRTCYQSQDKITGDSADRFCKMLLKRGHESVLEHKSITVKIVCDRSASQQLVRHRFAAYSQESQRYCNYGGKDMEFIVPPAIKEKHFSFEEWKRSILSAEQNYNRLVVMEKILPEDARSVLPNAAKTEVVTTYNVRVWRHVFDMRCDSHAQWQIREIMLSILWKFHELAPCLFQDKFEKFCE